MSAAYGIEFRGGGEMGERLRALDWATTPLGPITAWPDALKIGVRVLLTSGQPMLIAYGPEFVLMYNDGCCPLLGRQKHPMSFGARAVDAFPELWPAARPSVDHVVRTGSPLTAVDLQCLLDRDGYLEECYVTLSCSPLADAAGSVGGVLIILVETTDAVISARRLRTLCDLAVCDGWAKDPQTVCRAAASALARNGRDVPFAVIYLSDEADERWRLSATAGIDVHHPFMPLMPFDGNQPFFLSEVLLSRQAVVFRPESHVGAAPAGSWNVPPRSLIAVPMLTAGQFLPRGLLIAGLNPHRPIDLNSRTFFESVARQIGSHLEVTHLRAKERLGDQLAERIRVTAVEQDRIASLELSEKLLRLVTSVLDVRKVFARISDLSQQVLPHDWMTLTFHTSDGTAVQHACSHDGGPTDCQFHLVAPDERWAGSSFGIVDDLAAEPEWVVPAEIRDDVVAAGYRSMLLVRLSVPEQQWSVEFYSRQPNAFRAADAPTARRIADPIALALSHERLAIFARETDKARVRAEQLEAKVSVLSQQLDARVGSGRIVGESPEWKAVLKQAAQVADTEATVLLTGESGTGKEVIACFIHRGSARKAGPFLALNCATVPEHLFESELFGYERGAFTDAHQSKPGYLELAAGGVLFLDEVGDMSPSTQAKFLRVLQQREFQRLGGTRVLKADVRVIAATNRNLTKAIAQGLFREDLYYRLRVFEIHIPPLRERDRDVLPLAHAFLAHIAGSLGRPVPGLTQDAKHALAQYRWPGNVRELENTLQRAVILSDGSLITAEHLSLDGSGGPASSATPTTHLPTVERDVIERVLHECRGNKAKAASRLGISRNQLYVRLRRYNLD